jgi:hypothetical protein
MKKFTIFLLSAVLVFIFSSPASARCTVTINNLSFQRIQVTIAAYYLVTSQDTCTAFLEPQQQGGTCSSPVFISGWRVIGEKEQITHYNPANFKQTTCDFTLYVYHNCNQPDQLLIWDMVGACPANACGLP